ncbi:MAG: DJ-1/PfpI family protein [Elusimicrobia bacterium]|nr:DJ-1/PfpI family protein [Elusimicrobiota bacterium]
MGKKVLLILADGFEEMEAIAPMDILRRAGLEVTIAGLSGSAIKSARGVTVSTDVLLGQVSGDFDALLLPGGGVGAQNLAESKKVKDLILQQHKKGKGVYAICASPVLVLSPTGILNGKSATCYQGMESGFDKNVRYVDQKVVIDGNIITSKGPGTAVEFALSIVEKLCGKEESQKIRKDILA